MAAAEAGFSPEKSKPLEDLVKGSSEAAGLSSGFLASAEADEGDPNPPKAAKPDLGAEESSPAADFPPKMLEPVSLFAPNAKPAAATAGSAVVVVVEAGPNENVDLGKAAGAAPLDPLPNAKLGAAGAAGLLPLVPAPSLAAFFKKSNAPEVEDAGLAAAPPNPPKEAKILGPSYKKNGKIVGSVKSCENATWVVKVFHQNQAGNHMKITLTLCAPAPRLLAFLMTLFASSSLSACRNTPATSGSSSSWKFDKMVLFLFLHSPSLTTLV